MVQKVNTAGLSSLFSDRFQTLSAVINNLRADMSNSGPPAGVEFQVHPRVRHIDGYCPFEPRSSRLRSLAWLLGQSQQMEVEVYGCRLYCDPRLLNMDSILLWGSLTTGSLSCSSPHDLNLTASMHLNTFFSVSPINK